MPETFEKLFIRFDFDLVDKAISRIFDMRYIKAPTFMQMQLSVSRILFERRSEVFVKMQDNGYYMKSLYYDIPKSKNEFKYDNLLDTTDWIDFEVGKLFEKVKVKKHSSTPEINGASPFISSTSLNNGVSTYVADETIPGNCITVSTNGDCFDAFYQEEPIVISSDVEVLYSDFLNKKIAMFICTILEMEKYKWSYGIKTIKENDDYSDLRIHLYGKTPVSQLDNIRRLSWSEIEGNY